MDASAGMAEIVTLALAVAASPFAIIPSILLLFTGRPRATGLSFLAGWSLGLLLTATAATVLATGIERVDGSPGWVAWARIALGLALLVLGARKWWTRRAEKPAPKWMATIEESGPLRAFALALAMAVANPKILLLAAAAGVTIGSAEAARAWAIAALATFTVIASITVAVPIALYLIIGDRILDPLGRARDWLVRNNSAVMAVVIVSIGAVLLAEGISGL